MNEHYIAVIKDLNSRRKPILASIDELNKKLAELDSLLLGMQALAGDSFESESVVKAVPGWDSQTYTHMSMRWAIMYMLTEHTQGQRLATADIAARLAIGGFPQSGNFNSKVSAILSQMLPRNEVSRTDNGWGITPHGQEVWKNVKIGEKFLNRHNSPTDTEY